MGCLPSAMPCQMTSAEAIQCSACAPTCLHCPCLTLLLARPSCFSLLLADGSPAVQRLVGWRGGGPLSLSTTPEARSAEITQAAASLLCRASLGTMSSALIHRPGAVADAEVCAAPGSAQYAAKVHVCLLTQPTWHALQVLD